MKLVVKLYYLTEENITSLKKETSHFRASIHTEDSITTLTTYGAYDDLVYLIYISARLGQFEAHLI